MQQDANRQAGQAADAGSSSRMVALASFIGTTTEWYDFFLYGTTAALVTTLSRTRPPAAGAAVEAALMV